MRMPGRHELKKYEDFTEQEAKLVDQYTDPKSPTYRNKVRSYEAAGYYFAYAPEGVEDDGRGYRAARVAAHKLFKKEHIQAEIEKRFKEEAEYLKLPMEELLVKLSDVADSDLMQYLHPVPACCPHCEEDLGFTIEYQFDIEQMKRDGVGALLKKMKPTKFGSEFEFHDAAEALNKLMKHYGGYEKARKSDLSDFDEIIVAARKHQH